MGLDVRIEGGKALKDLAALMIGTGKAGLAREMSRGLSRAAEPLKASITRETLAAMPSEGGYRSLIAKSLRHRVSRRSSGHAAQLMLATYADGTSQRRDIRALNNGILRHPVYGRSRRVKVGARKGTIIPNPWAVTTVRSGFHDRGVAQAMNLVTDALGDVLEEYAERLADG